MKDENSSPRVCAIPYFYGFLKLLHASLQLIMHEAGRYVYFHIRSRAMGFR